MFSRDPAGQRVDAMLVEYCPGLGERLVSGAVTPSRLRVDRESLAVTMEYLADDSETLPANSISAIQALARMALKLEKHFNVAQDLEWCIDAAGQPIIVQSRAATRLAEPLRKIHWSNANIAENFPEAVSPLLFSIVKPGYSAYFRNLGRGFGLSRRRLAAMATPLQNIVGLQGGRLYYNLSNIHWLLQVMPAGRRLVAFFNLFVGAAEIPAQPPVRLGPLGRTIETLRVVMAICWQYIPVAWRMRRFEARADRFAERTQPEMLAGKTAAQLVADLRGFLTIRLTQWNDAALADTAAMVCYGLLKAQLARHLPGNDHDGIHNDLLKGLPGLASAEPVIRLWELSQRIQADPALKELFGQTTAEAVLAGLSRPEHSDFQRAFFGYLKHWGFRSSAELMLTRPTPAEDPRPVIRLLQAYVLARADSPRALSRAQGAERHSTTAAVAARLSPAPWVRWLPLISRASRFRILLRATQGSIKLRERARMKQALLYTRLRHIVLGLGDRLVANGTIQQRDDIFLLTTQEVMAMASGTPITPELTATIETRRQALSENQTVEPPDRLVLTEDEQWHPAMVGAQRDPGAAPAPVLQGNGACGGAVSGSAAVVLDVAQADRVQAGQILVTRQTDPGWAAVFFLVKGLVIERGGMLSHGAIIAREYGIPAVVGVVDATRLIHDGDHLRVDGDQGRVELNGQ
jgi:pyruvate,water dikinase